MKILINVSGNYGGGGLQVAVSFIYECLTFKNNSYHILLGKNIAYQVNKRDFPDNFIFYDIPTLKFYQFNKYLSKIEKSINPEVVFSVFGPSYWRPNAPHIVGYAIAHYIYDDSPFWRTISIYQRAKWYMKKKIHLFFFNKDSNVIVCETEDVTNRIQKIFPQKRIFTVSNTCSSYFFDPKFRSLPSKLYPSHKFRFLTLSKYYIHKNLHLIKPIIDELKLRGVKDIQFVLTITYEEYEKLFSNKYLEYVTTVGPINANECPSLYNECNACFLPTLLECFTANYPEAMAMKKPIITSDLGFARTICKDAAIYFDPLNIDDIVNKILILYTNINLQHSLINKGSEIFKRFPTATQRAESYLEICDKVLKNNSIVSR